MLHTHIPQVIGEAAAQAEHSDRDDRLDPDVRHVGLDDEMERQEEQSRGEVGYRDDVTGTAL